MRIKQFLLQITFPDVYQMHIPFLMQYLSLMDEHYPLRLVGIIKLFPATKITAIVSPIALPIPNTIAVIIPDFAAGTTTLKIVPICDAPSANDPSRYVFGTARIAVSATVTIVGNIMIANTRITAIKLCPFAKPKVFCKNGTIIASPNTPYNTDGIPANNCTAGEIILAIF